MRSITCLCGVRITADDGEALVGAYQRHNEETHANLNISPRRLADAYGALRRTGGWDGGRAALGSEIEIRPLSPDLADEYLAFFDNDAFSDNPAWASCYCLGYEMNLRPREWEDRTAAENRAEKERRIKAAESTGVLAFDGARVVGWCHAAPRASLPLLDRTPGFESDDRTGAIVCFVVPPQYRGQGLSRRLLDGACDLLRAKGFVWLDVYPPQQASTAAGSYHGSRKMYEAAGFEHVRDAGRYAVMRKAL